MPHKVRGRTRHPAPRQIVRAGHYRARHLAKLTGHKAGVWHFPDSDSTIDAFIDEVHQTVAQIQCHLNPNIVGHVTGDHRNHMLATETRRRRNTHMPRSLQSPLHHSGFSTRQIAKQALTILKKRLPFKGQGKPPRRTHKQSHAKSRLKCINPPPDHCRRHPFKPRSCRERTSHRRIHERLDLHQTICHSPSCQTVTMERIPPPFFAQSRATQKLS